MYCRIGWLLAPGNDCRHLPAAPKAEHNCLTYRRVDSALGRVDASKFHPCGRRLSGSCRQRHAYRAVCGVRRFDLSAHRLGQRLENRRADGSRPGPEEFEPGFYDARFYLADYFRASIGSTAAVPFLDVVSYRFGLAEPEAHYHLPMKCTPWGYSCFPGWGIGVPGPHFAWKPGTICLPRRRS